MRHRYHGLRHSGTLPEPCKTTKKWGVLCHSQSANHCQDGCHQQGQWALWTPPRNLCRNFWGITDLSAQGTGCSLLFWNKIFQVWGGSPSMDRRHRGKGKPDGPDYWQTSSYWGSTSWGHCYCSCSGQFQCLFRDELMKWNSRSCLDRRAFVHNYGWSSRVDFKKKFPKKAACIVVPQLPFLGNLNQPIISCTFGLQGKICWTLE